MPDILEVTADDIGRLSDSQLPQLIEKLLQAEKRNVRRDDATIIVSYEVRARDEGIDGEWTIELNPNEMFGDIIPADVRQFIPTPSVIYQCKATAMSANECAKEVMKGDDLKPAIRERLEAESGQAAYVIACTQKVGNRDKRREREEKCAEQIQSLGIGAPTVRFLDAELLAEWSNRHIATRRFVVRKAGRELAAGVYLLKEWGNDPDVQNFPFCANDELRSLISDIRNALAVGTPIIRVTGNSGLGKTRIVYEVFSAFLEGDGMSNDFAQGIGSSVVYVDLESPTSVAENLGAVREACLRGDRGIVVIDNCPVEKHEDFAKWFLEVQCKLKLITIDYFEDEGSSRGKSFQLQPELFRGVIPEILRKSPVSQNLTDGAISAIADFAQGYARVAVLAAELGRAPTATDRNHKEYVDRLLWGRNPPDPIGRHKDYIKALSSVAVLGISGRVANQYEYLLRKLLQSDSTDHWRKELNFFTRRHILEPLGDFMVVSPAPVAVALFSQWLEETPPDDVVEFAQGLADIGLLDSFCRQLRRLGMNPTAGEIAKRFCAGPFASAENLISGTGSQILRALAELNPSAVAQTLRAAFADKTLEQILKLEGTVRRNLVDTCVRLAVEEPTFKDALWLLVLFAAAENEHWANNASGYLKQLFHSHLSGTHVSGFERLRLARESLINENQAIRKVMITAVADGLQFGHFSRISTASLTRELDATLDWEPANNEEELSYYKGCYEILHGIIMAGGADSEWAKNALGENITAILQTPLIETLDHEFKQLSERLGHVWPQVKDHIKRILELHEDLLPKHRLALERWKSYLTPPPSALEDRLQDIVSSPGWHHRKGADGHYIDLSEKEAEHLGLELIEKNIDLTPYLPQLMSGPQQQGFSFGATFGKNSASAMHLVEAAFELWPTLDPKTRDTSALRGILWGLGKGKDRQRILDTVNANDELLDLLVPLSASVDAIEESDFLRISRAVEQGRLDPWKLRNLVQGQPMRDLPIDFITKQFQHLLHAKPDAAQVLFEILFLHCHGQPEKFDAFASLFRELLLQKALPVFDGHFGWEWHDAAKRLITLTSDEKWLGKLAEYVRDALLERESWATDDFLTAVVSQLFQKAPGITWDVFSQGLREGDDFQKYILSRFLGKSGSRFDDTGSPLWNLPDDRFRAWSRANRDLIPLVLERISLYTVEKSEDGSERFVWHPHARILLDEGIEQEDLASAIAINLASFGSVGSRVPYLEKRLRLVEDLLSVDNVRLRNIAERLQEEFKQYIRSTRQTELNEQARFV